MIRRSFMPAVAALCVACSTPGQAAPPSPSEVFDRYVSAVHAADMDAVRALIAPDVERSDFAGCRPEMDNPTCLAHYVEVTVVKPRARMLEVRSALYEKAGVHRILGRDIVRVHDGRIVSFRFVPDFSDEATAMFFGTLGIGPRARRP